MTSKDKTQVQADAGGVGTKECIEPDGHRGLDQMNWMPNKNVDNKLTFNQ